MSKVFISKRGKLSIDGSEYPEGLFYPQFNHNESEMAIKTVMADTALVSMRPPNLYLKEDGSPYGSVTEILATIGSFFANASGYVSEADKMVTTHPLFDEGKVYNFGDTMRRTENFGSKKYKCMYDGTQGQFTSFRWQELGSELMEKTKTVTTKIPNFKNGFYAELDKTHVISMENFEFSWSHIVNSIPNDYGTVVAGILPGSNTQFELRVDKTNKTISLVQRDHGVPETGGTVVVSWSIDISPLNTHFDSLVRFHITASAISQIETQVNLHYSLDENFGEKVLVGHFSVDTTVFPNALPLSVIGSNHEHSKPAGKLARIFIAGKSAKHFWSLEEGGSNQNILVSHPIYDNIGNAHGVIHGSTVWEDLSTTRSFIKEYGYDEVTNPRKTFASGAVAVSNPQTTSFAGMQLFRLRLNSQLSKFDKLYIFRDTAGNMVYWDKSESRFLSKQSDSFVHTPQNTSSLSAEKINSPTSDIIVKLSKRPVATGDPFDLPISSTVTVVADIEPTEITGLLGGQGSFNGGTNRIDNFAWVSEDTFVAGNVMGSSWRGTFVKVTKAGNNLNLQSLYSRNSTQVSSIGELATSWEDEGDYYSFTDIALQWGGTNIEVLLNGEVAAAKRTASATPSGGALENLLVADAASTPALWDATFDYFRNEASYNEADLPSQPQLRFSFELWDDTNPNVLPSIVGQDSALTFPGGGVHLSTRSLSSYRIPFKIDGTPQEHSLSESEYTRYPFNFNGGNLPLQPIEVISAPFKRKADKKIAYWTDAGIFTTLA